MLNVTYKSQQESMQMMSKVNMKKVPLFNLLKLVKFLHWHPYNSLYSLYWECTSLTFCAGLSGLLISFCVIHGLMCDTGWQVTFKDIYMMIFYRSDN